MPLSPDGIAMCQTRGVEAQVEGEGPLSALCAPLSVLVALRRSSDGHRLARGRR